MAKSELITKVQRRQTGKTTEVIEMMNKDPQALLIVHLNAVKQHFPKELQPRIFSVRSFLNGRADGLDFDRVIIDEGFTIDKEEMARFYYHLGANQINAFAIGSITKQ